MIKQPFCIYCIWSDYQQTLFTGGGRKQTCSKGGLWNNFEFRSGRETSNVNLRWPQYPLSARVDKIRNETQNHFVLSRVFKKQWCRTCVSTHVSCHTMVRKSASDHH